ncbi:hypothetical protein EV424DRAFT_1536175 [Suillus variegatus]|nr:hypothetical protein EV424DRAFT_1536175 [Suillus variegatus]
MLPSPPRWKYQTVLTKFPTTKTLHVFYQDAIECLQSLLSHPLLVDSFDFIPQKVYESAECAVHIYYGFMTGDCAWELQEHLPDGATLLGVVLSSDKAKVSNLSGNHYAHPLLISLANINSDIRGKGSLEAYIPLALLPIAKFIHANQHMRGVLGDQLFHQCIGIIVEPLKQAVCLGVMMSDPAGFSRYCFMPLVAYVVDTPEELSITCITMTASPVTMATHVNFGDSTRHPLRKGLSTLANIRAVANFVSPSELMAFFEECKQHFLNGVLTPFWLDWLTTDPSSFLTPELLHHLHKMFWDHDLRWCIKVVSAKEIDFCFALLQMCIGYRAFKEGISDLKQTSGRDHRNVQHYIIGIIANAAPVEFITAIWALVEFRYLAQAPWFTDEKLIKLDGSLRLSLPSTQAQGKNGGIKPWAIPKLELLQGVVLSIRSHGAIMQWSADPTEHTHITVMKQPARAGNNHDHDTQVCRYLDCHDKVDRFDLAIKICELEDCTNIGDDSDNEDIDSRMVRRSVKDYFARARELLDDLPQEHVVQYFKMKPQDALKCTQATLSRKLKDHQQFEQQINSHPNALLSKWPQVVTRPDVEDTFWNMK